MKIKQIEIYKSPIRLKEPFIISLGSFDYANNIIVVIRTDNGIEGYGECSPFMSINGETMETCSVVGQYIGGALIGKDPLKIEECSDTMDEIIYGNASIKSAFDIAIHDIASQYAGLPLYEFLGGNKKKMIVTDYTVSLGSPDKMASDALRIVQTGFQIIKVKLGCRDGKDIERIRKIREAVGYDIPVRIDANQGWTSVEAISNLYALGSYKIDFCEEPIPRWDYTSLPEVKSHSPVPVMADESCGDDHDARRLIALNACDSFNIKLGKSSGITKAMKIIRLAEDAVMKMQVGGFLESRLGFTASAHLALVSDNIVFFDFDSPLMFEEDPVIGGITYGAGGVVTVPDAPGLGAKADRNYLGRLEKVIVK